MEPFITVGIPGIWRSALDPNSSVIKVTYNHTLDTFWGVNESGHPCMVAEGTGNGMLSPDVANKARAMWKEVTKNDTDATHQH